MKRQVGGHTTVVRLNDQAGIRTAAAILTDVVGRSPDQTAGNEVAAPVTGDDEVFLNGAPAGDTVTSTLIWCAVLVAVFCPLAVRAYGRQQ